MPRDPAIAFAVDRGQCPSLPSPVACFSSFARRESQSNTSEHCEFWPSRGSKLKREKSDPNLGQTRLPPGAESALQARVRTSKPARWIVVASFAECETLVQALRELAQLGHQTSQYCLIARPAQMLQLDALCNDLLTPLISRTQRLMIANFDIEVVATGGHLSRIRRKAAFAEVAEQSGGTNEIWSYSFDHTNVEFRRCNCCSTIIA